MDLKETYTHSSEVRHPWELSRSHFFKNAVKNVCGSQTDVKILDVGSGDAWLANEIGGYLGDQAQIFCCDTNYTNKILEKLESVNLNIPRSNYLKQHPGDHFDLISLFDVVEHVEKDNDFLSNIVQQNLKRSGKVLISVPAWPHLFSEHDRFLGHYRRYTLKSLRMLAETCQLQVLKSGGLFTSLFFARNLQIPFSKKSTDSQHNELGKWNRGKAMTKSITSVLDFDNFINYNLSKLGIALPGLSWWCLCQKR